MHLGQTTAPTPASYPILQTLAQLAPAIGNIIGQVKLADLNMELIKQGRPTLTAAQAQALSPRIDVGIAPDTQSAIVYLGLGIGALFLLSMLTKAARR